MSPHEIFKVSILIICLKYWESSNRIFLSNFKWNRISGIFPLWIHKQRTEVNICLKEQDCGILSAYFLYRWLLFPLIILFPSPNIFFSLFILVLYCGVEGGWLYWKQKQPPLLYFGHVVSTNFEIVTFPFYPFRFHSLMPAIFCHYRSNSLLIIMLMSKTPALDSRRSSQRFESWNIFYQLLLYG